MNLSNLVEEYCTQLRRRYVEASTGIETLFDALARDLRYYHPQIDHSQSIPRDASPPHSKLPTFCKSRGGCVHLPLLLLRSVCCDGCRQIHGSFACAKKTAEVMRLLITTQRHPDAAALIEDVRTVGTKLQAAKPVGERACPALHRWWEVSKCTRACNATSSCKQ